MGGNEGECSPVTSVVARVECDKTDPCTIWTVFTHEAVGVRPVWEVFGHQGNCDVDPL